MKTSKRNDAAPPMIYSIKEEYGFRRGCLKESKMKALLGATKSELRWRWLYIQCRLFGHKLEEDVLDPESGKSVLSCTRCGYTHGHYYMGG